MLNHIPHLINGRAVAGRESELRRSLIQLSEVRCRGYTSATLMLFAGWQGLTIRSRGSGVAPTIVETTKPTLRATRTDFGLCMLTKSSTARANTTMLTPLSAPAGGKGPGPEFCRFDHNY
jgi:hypothetical protein